MSEKEKIKAGDHIGHVVAWGILEGKQAPQVFAQMDIGLSWFGSLKEGRAREITLESLVTMGFKGDDLMQLVRNPDSALDKTKDLRLVVEYDAQNTDKNGDPRAVIRWVNEIGGFKNQMDESNALKALSGMKVKGDLMKIRQEKGVKAEPAPQTDMGDDEEIPF